MNKVEEFISFIEKVENPALIIPKMFQFTDSEGNICIPSWHYLDENYSERDYFECKLNWNKKDCDDACLIFEKMISDIHSLADNNKDNDAVVFDKLSEMNQDDYSAWSILVEKRVPSQYAADFLLETAQRLFQLVELDAPELIIKNEEKHLAIGLVVNKYATYLSLLKR